MTEEKFYRIMDSFFKPILAPLEWMGGKFWDFIERGEDKDNEIDEITKIDNSTILTPKLMRLE